MLGIALGAFTQGFSQGIDMGTRLSEVREKNQLRSGIKQATTEGTAEFEQKVATGEETEGDWQAMYSNYIVPRTAHQYAVNGQPDMAAKWMEWSESNDAKRGTKLFTTGLGKLQTGDIQGGIDDMTKAANLQGYGPKGKMTASEYYDEAAGKVTGYRFDFTDEDGNVHSKNVASEDVAQFMAGIANPQSAFELDQAGKTARSKADLEVETHVRKKSAEAALGIGGGGMTAAQYQNAIQEERKAIQERALTDPELEGVSSAEMETMAKAAVDARLGKTAPAGETVTVDPETGEPIDTTAAETPATDAAQPPPAEPTDEDLNVSEAAPAPAGPAAAAPGVTVPTEATSAPTDQRQQYITQAQQALRQGADAGSVGKALAAAGIPPDQWPQDLQLAAKNAQLGLGAQR